MNVTIFMQGTLFYVGGYPNLWIWCINQTGVQNSCGGSEIYAGIIFCGVRDDLNGRNTLKCWCTSNLPNIASTLPGYKIVVRAQE